MAQRHPVAPESMTEPPVYSIGAVAGMLEVPASTLRAWEERYGVVVPARSAGGQRLYSRRQVELLRLLKDHVEGGLSAADAHRLLADSPEGGSAPPALRDDSSPRQLVLIAERDQYGAELAEYFLQTEGYEVCLALDAAQAELLFQERAPDLVIIDLLISGGAGFRLCRQFSNAKTQVVAVSALDSAAEALNLGASAFIPKPIEPLRLVTVVRDLVGTSALGRSAHGRRRVHA